MQEFTIPLKSNGSEKASKRSASSKNSIRKKLERAKLPSTQPSKLKISSKVDPGKKLTSRGINKTVLIVSFLAAFFFCVAAIFAYLYFFNEVEPVVQEETESRETDTPTVNLLEDKLIYTDGFNIFLSDKTGGEVEMLTDYKEDGEIFEVELIDGANLGFARCLKGNSGCSILTFDIAKKQAEQLRVLEADSRVRQLSWRDEQSFAYTTENQEMRKLIFVYVDGSEEQTFSTLNFSQGSRDAFVEDDAQIHFSPKGDKLYFINTKTLNGFNFSITVYDLEGNVISTIEDATDPTWIDNDSIIYRSYSNESQGYLHIFNLDDEESMRLTKSKEASYSPKVSGDKLLAWEAKGLGTGYMLGLESAEIKEFSANTAFPIWLSEDEVILAVTKKCVAACDLYYEADLGFTIEAFKVFDLESESETEIELETEDLQRGILTLNNIHI
jgi:hypothetical protein